MYAYSPSINRCFRATDAPGLANSPNILSNTGLIAFGPRLTRPSSISVGEFLIHTNAPTVWGVAPFLQSVNAILRASVRRAISGFISFARKPA
jgi:hypothetical protein